MARNPLQATPLAASTPLPSWWDNPIGTQRDDQTYASAIRGDESFDPVVAYWPTGKPMLKSEYDGMQNASLALFDRLSMVGGGVGRAANPLASAPKGRLRAGNLDKDVVKMSYDAGHWPPPQTPRDVALDYKKGVPLDDTGRIARTIEGVPLTAQNVAGRRQADNMGSFPDRGLDDEGIKSIGTDARGARFLGVQKSELPRGAVGAYNPRTGLVRYDQAMPPDQQALTRAHEVGHILDEMAGTIPTTALNKELRAVWHAGYVGKLSQSKHDLIGPELLKYARKSDTPGELMAEAYRMYLHDPNFMKAVAPKVAAAIRKAVNTNPELNKWIQFNTLSGIAGGGAAATGSQWQQEVE